MKACAVSRRKIPKDSFWFQEQTNAGDKPGCLKASGVTSNKHKAAMANSSSIFCKKSSNTEMLQQFLTNLFLEFLLFSALVPNQTRVACKHWQRWARRTSFSPLRKSMSCRSSDTILGILFLFVCLHFGDWPKLEKPEKPKWDSLRCSASWN